MWTDNPALVKILGLCPPLDILPPGAFIGPRLLIAVKNVIDSRIERRSAQAVSLPHEAVAAA